MRALNDAVGQQDWPRAAVLAGVVTGCMQILLRCLHGRQR